MADMWIEAGTVAAMIAAGAGIIAVWVTVGGNRRARAIMEDGLKKTEELLKLQQAGDARLVKAQRPLMAVRIEPEGGFRVCISLANNPPLPVWRLTAIVAETEGGALRRSEGGQPKGLTDRIVLSTPLANQPIVDRFFVVAPAGPPPRLFEVRLEFERDDGDRWEQKIRLNLQEVRLIE